MPEYDLLAYKIQAREYLAQFYKTETRQDSIPPLKQYWTLCSRQTRRSHSEINQMVSLGLIRKDQFYGVDHSVTNIKKNKISHPEAHWFYGDWDKVLKRHLDIFDPAIVYLDSTSMPKTNHLIQMVLNIMLYSRVDTMVFVNVMLNNPRDPKIVFTESDFINELNSKTYVQFINKWKFYGKAIIYCATGQTTMATYPFRRIQL